MIELVKIAVFFAVAMLSGGYRMDEQFALPHSMQCSHVRRINRKFKKYFVFKDKSGRNSFLAIAVYQEMLAYILLISNLVFIIAGVYFNFPNIYVVVAKYVDLVIFLADVIAVIVFGLFYRIRAKIEKK